MLTIAAVLASAAPAAAEQIDDRPSDQRPSRDTDKQLPPKPAGLVAWTGSVSVTPEIGKVGDRFTVSYHQQPAGPAWSLDRMGGTCSGGPTKYDGKHLPLAEIGGYSSCTWVAKQPTGGWAEVGAQISGPCGDPDLVRRGIAEFAICQGIKATDHYVVLGDKDNVVEGHIRGSEGDAVPGIRVEVKGKGASFNKFTVTNSDGFYSMRVDKGAYLVRPSYFDDDHFGGLTGDDFDPHDKSVSVSGKVAVDFTVKGHRLSGHVRDPKGKGLAGETLGIRSNRGLRTATTGSDGAYVITVPAGSYAVDVESPKPPPNITVNKIFDAPYRCTAAGSGPKDYFCKAEMTRDRENVNFEFNTDLSLDMRVAPKPDAAGRYEVTIEVVDSRRQPVGNQKVHIQPPGAVSPRALVCNGKGGRLYPANTPIAGADYVVDSDFDLPTDDQGRIQFWVWPGTQGGQWRLDAKIPDSTKTSEFATSTFNIPARGGTDAPATDAKAAAAVIEALKAQSTGLATQNVQQVVPPEVHVVFRAFYGKTVGASAAMDILGTALASAANFPYSAHPIHSADGSGGGLLVLPGQPDGALIKQVDSFLARQGPAPNLWVLDTVALAKQLSSASVNRDSGADPWSRVTVPMVKLSDWPGKAAGGPVIGHPAAGSDEAQFTYFGWPQRPVESTPLDACAGITSRVITVGKASPVRLLFTNAAGQRVGDATDGSNEPIVEVPGASVTTGPGEQVRYVMPRDQYSVSVLGTGSGKARIFANSGVRVRDEWVYDLEVSSGLKGAFTLGPSGMDPTLSWGGATIAVRRALALQVKGMPARIGLGKHQEYPVTVIDEFGDPVPFASLLVSAGNYNIGATANAEGKANLLLYGDPDNQTLTTRIAAPGYAPMDGKIAVAKAGRPEVDGAIRAYIGPEQKVILPAPPGLDLGPPITLGVVTLTVLVAILYLRNDQRRQRALATVRSSAVGLAGRVQRAAAGTGEGPRPS